MSELVITSRTNVRRQLLATASAFALLTIAAAQAKAEDADRPTVWIELGGQLERMGNSEQVFVPSFLSQFDRPELKSVLPQQRPPLYSNGVEGRISLTPDGSDWVFSAAVRYGRANSQRSLSQQLPKAPAIKGQQGPQHLVYYLTQKIPTHINSFAENVDRHLVLDFQVGKDVGLGLFSDKAASVVSLGVRFAQFTSSRNAAINGAPNYHISGSDRKYGIFWSHHHYAGTMAADSSFNGVGPSLSWDASAPLVQRGDDGEISVDWGLNAAVLFGRQKVRGETDITGTHYTRYAKTRPPVRVTYNTVRYDHPNSFNRSRRVTVPNLGGFAGVSFRYSDLKVSFGYRGEIYFGAMDGGIDTRKTYNQSFYGPFATISLGLGG